MSLKNKIIVELEREVMVGPVVFDLTMLLGCNASIPKSASSPIEGMVVASYWLSKGENQPPLYQVSCRGLVQQGQKYPKRAYYFEVSAIQEESIPEELETRVRDTIRKAPMD